MISASTEEVQVGAAIGGSLILVLLLAGAVGWLIVLQKLRRKEIDASVDVQNMPGRQWCGEDLLVAGVCISSLLVFFAAVGLWVRQREIGALWLHLLAVLQNTILHVAVAGVLISRMYKSGGNWTVRFGIPHFRDLAPTQLLLQVGTWYILALPLVVFAGLVSLFLVSFHGGGHMFQPVLTLFMDASTPSWFQFWIFMVAVVGAPAIEEMFFRGVMLPVLIRRCALWPGVLLCSLFFALVHGHTQSFLPLFVFGLGLSVAYIRSRNLLVPIGMHALFNAVNLVVLLLSGTTF